MLHFKKAAPTTDCNHPHTNCLIETDKLTNRTCLILWNQITISVSVKHSNSSCRRQLRRRGRHTTIGGSVWTHPRPLGNGSNDRRRDPIDRQYALVRAQQSYGQHHAIS